MKKQFGEAKLGLLKVIVIGMVSAVIGSLAVQGAVSDKSIKVVKEGSGSLVIDAKDKGNNYSLTQEINHNLGYAPRVIAYGNVSNKEGEAVSPISNGGIAIPQSFQPFDSYYTYSARAVYVISANDKTVTIGLDFPSDDGQYNGEVFNYHYYLVK